jgi:hypothetical protein
MSHLRGSVPVGGKHGSPVVKLYWAFAPLAVVPVQVAVGVVSGVTVVLGKLVYFVAGVLWLAPAVPRGITEAINATATPNQTPEKR